MGGCLASIRGKHSEYLGHKFKHRGFLQKSFGDRPTSGTSGVHKSATWQVYTEEAKLKSPYLRKAGRRPRCKVQLMKSVIGTHIGCNWRREFGVDENNILNISHHVC